MGGFLGAIASVGILLLAAVLAVLFLRRLGMLKDEAVRRMGKAAAMTLGVACVYWLTGVLLSQVLRGGPDSAAELSVIFPGTYLTAMLEALPSPSWFAPVSGLFAYLGHGAGKLLFGHYLLGGEILALGCVFCSVCLLMDRGTAIGGAQAAEDGVFLLLCLPGAAFVFLPGWPPLLLLILSIAAYGIGKRVRPRRIVYSPSLYAWILAGCALLSAAVEAGMVLGRIG